MMSYSPRCIPKMSGYNDFGYYDEQPAPPGTLPGCLAERR